MGQQIVHRLLISFPALLGVLFLCFCLLQVVPADPAMIIAGPDAKAETIAAIRLELGLDRSIPVQFFEYILRVLRGDLGRSIISNRMVSEELAMTIGPTVELMLGAMLIAVPGGLALGTLAAVNRGPPPMSVWGTGSGRLSDDQKEVVARPSKIPTSVATASSKVKARIHNPTKRSANGPRFAHVFPH
jgi:ABC-type dipeptide/oligopeptide/nickel transport system permease component